MVSSNTALPRRLPIVTPEQEISGRYPRQFERIVKTCREGDAGHAAALYGALTVATRGIDQCLPPTSRNQYREALALVREWCAGHTPFRQIRDLRAALFSATIATEQKVQATMASAFATQPRRDMTSLDAHADQVVQRYLGLSLHYAIGAALLVVDGTKDATRLLDVPGEVAGAIAYKQVALGAARSPELRNAALSQATWEHRRVVGSAGHSEASIGVQLFHEYLGVHWKNHVDAQRLYLEEFLVWAFDPTA